MVTNLNMSTFALYLSLLVIGAVLFGCDASSNQALMKQAEEAQKNCEPESFSRPPDVAITSVTEESAPVPHCKVAGVIGTETHFELLLPDDWNGKFVMGGGGGFVGSVINTAFAYLPLQKGYATVGTDTGHQGHPIDASWAHNNLERIVSFGHQAVHRTAVTAKALIADYYDSQTSRSYFTGCSRGGGQALMEAQRYPEDFDGIVAGAPAFSWTVELGARNTLINQAMFPDANDLSVAVITPEAQELIGNAVMAKCDVLDGLEDNIINDPTVCDFDVASLSCGDRQSKECLTNEQVRAAENVYGDVVVNGKRLFPGYPVGAEAYPGGWARWLTGGVSLGDVGEFQEGVAADSPFPEPETPNAHWAFGNGVMKYLVFNDPDWDYTTYDFEDFEEVTAAAAQTLNATSSDLDAFRARGGKLLLHNGWGDMALTAYGTIEYYESVIERAPDARDDVRLFLMPGVEHCFGGPGPSYVDVLDAIDNWVETGSAPDVLPAVWLSEQFQPEGGRPVCAYPDVVTYDGQGDPRAPESFSCQLQL